ncbi:hypothetical protein RND81_02G027300 [Saponaria officinalis]|uniref:RING-type domain-containing protein n=1 Tax=Saponaria officinalis TaxID=3572 RepID=A0AAW1MPV5_SAPOF
MISDSTINASIPNCSKDFSKKKRANRSAKLKQCKLDARREQWLSQVKSKGLKERVSGDGEFNGSTIETRKEKAKGKWIGKEKEPCRKGIEVTSVNVVVMHNHDSDSEESLLVNSPTSSVNDSGNNFAGSSGSSTSRSSSASSLSFGSGGCCSGSISDEEEGGGDEFDGDNECLDDWETVADALVAAENNEKQDDYAQAEDEKSDDLGIFDRSGVNRKAWRPDDTSRPQSLPNLSKQRSFPASSERLSCHASNPRVRNMPPVVPTSCPICCEDLDLTDSHFLPCPCGFHLCLFCHKRILEEDSRCPGCRKPYSSDEVDKEKSVSGGNLTTRFARSCSMFSRV